MTKKLVIPMDLQIGFKEAGANVEVVLVALYHRESEEVRDQQQLAISLSAGQTTAIKNFIRTVIIPQIKIHEGISNG